MKAGILSAIGFLGSAVASLFGGFDAALETLLIVLVACRLDLVMGSNFIRDAAVIAFTANEGISIIENAGLMGIPMPMPVLKAIEVLKNKGGEEG